jgi:MoxR-like ATPase
MTALVEERLGGATDRLARLEAQIRRVYVGHNAVVRGTIVGLLARGNVLLEGAPGLGKTLLVRALASSLSLRFSRIQFTPDLMPADITGGTTLHRDETSGATELRFRSGPVFANLVLADEVNRGTPKTQSALLEAMQEHAVTISGERRVLEEPFQVIATQNPIEMEGTYPLPEAQLDRFLVKLQVGWPSFEELKRIGLETTGSRSVTLEPVLSRADVIDLQELTREIVVGPHIVDLAARLTVRTHPTDAAAPDVVRRLVRFGASPRATQALLLCGRANALIEGRGWVSPEDVLAHAPSILRHRIFLSFEAGMDGVKADDVVAAVLSSVAA